MSSSSLTIFPIPAFKDNYIWTFFDKNNHAWVVDPGDATPVIEVLEAKRLKLQGIFITHHHRDHMGGVSDLLKYNDRVMVVGSDKSPHDFIHQRVKEGDEVRCEFFSLKVLDIPGHTLDHVAYYNNEWLFCGDTLFSIGCGKIFEGTPLQMFSSLQKLSQLSDTIQVYCGHEYTVANLAFAQQVEPENAVLLEKAQRMQKIREKHLPSLPSRLSDEKQMNPFLRCEEASIKKAVEAHFNKKLDNAVEVFAYLREWKNYF